MTEAGSSPKGSNEHAGAAQRDWIKEGWEHYYVYTGKASDVARNLALVGFALVLLLGGAATDDFREARDEPVDLPGSLIVSGSLLVIGLTLDLAQYIYGAAAFDLWTRREESRRESQGATYEYPEGFPDKINWPSTFFFYSKVLLVIVGYIILLGHLAFAVK
jgi:hypothetical protein